MVGFVWGEVVTGWFFVQQFVLLLANYEVIVQSMAKRPTELEIIEVSWGNTKIVSRILRDIKGTNYPSTKWFSHISNRKQHPNQTV